MFTRIGTNFHISQTFLQKKISIYRDRSRPILSQYVDLSVFKIKSLYNKLGKLMPQGRKITKM